MFLRKNKELISNRKLVLKITFFTLLFSIVFILISSVYIKQTALDNLAEDDAKKTSELIFETMNTRMQEGWGKDDLKKIINRLEHIRNGLEVKSYRSQKVEEILGVHAEDKKIVESDIYIQKAMNGEKQFMIQDDGSIRYLYPMKVSSECITCHYNTKVGDVNGVLDISYPPSEIKISLDSMTHYFIIFFIVALLILFYVFFMIINSKMVKPIITLTDEIIQVSDNKAFDKEVNINSNIKEIKTLQFSFNKLIKTINMYYDKLLQNIYFNSLTSLPNRVKLEKDLENNENSTLIIVNIDDFKSINAFYGTKVGDKIIKTMAEILPEKIKNHGTLYKLHGDEFAILVNDNNIDKEFCENIIEYIKDYNFTYEKSTIHVTITLGITYNQKENIIEKTSTTVRKAINEGVSLKIFDDSLMVEDEYSNHIKWTRKIEKAIKEDRVVPYFQAIKNAKTDEIYKYECLARITKEGRVFTPFHFIEVAKQSKQYGSITRAMIKNSFEYFSDKEGIEFSINFSVEDILNERTMQYLFGSVEKYGVQNRLIIELLETEEFEDFSIINNFIKELKKHNIKVAIDDFGSGYSNFSYIANLNIDFLKLDSSLIENIHTCENSYKVVKNINSFAHDMGLKTIAEKVHCEEVEVLLKELEVDYLQGFHIRKPLEDIIL